MFGLLIFISIPVVQRIIKKFFQKKSLKGSVYQLDQKYIDEFIKYGVVVIHQILTEEEIQEVRKEFHLSLKNHGVSLILFIHLFLNYLLPSP